MADARHQHDPMLGVLREIAGHLNRVVQQNELIISLLLSAQGLRPLTDAEREWLKACRREIGGKPK
jgi:hypothetical protein